MLAAPRARVARPRPATRASSPALTGLALGALGVVFGDIGTSPHYALQSVFALDGGSVHTTPGDVYGVMSLVFWSITLIVSIKYVTFVMRADNDGEGGVLALAALVQRAAVKRAVGGGALVILGVFGAAERHRR
jgi:KUP system potassium uptake protein